MVDTQAVRRFLLAACKTLGIPSSSKKRCAAHMVSKYCTSEGC